MSCNPNDDPSEVREAYGARNNISTAIGTVQYCIAQNTVQLQMFYFYDDLGKRKGVSYGWVGS